MSAPRGRVKDEPAATAGVKQSAQVGRSALLQRPKETQKRYKVEELDQERAVTSIYTTVTFRPNEILLEKRDKIKIELAHANGIQLRKL